MPGNHCERHPMSRRLGSGSGRGTYRSAAALMCTTVKARRSLNPRVTMSRTTSRRAGAVTTFSQYLTGQLVFQKGVREQLLETGVFDLELFQALRVRDAHAAELAPPEVVAALR